MPFTFVHAADLHLDCPFQGIGEVSPDIAAALRQATFDAWDNIVSLCIENGAAFLVVSGDVFNSKDRSLRAQLRFRDGLNRLADAGIYSYISYGNHDPADGWSAKLDWPETAHIFSHKSVETIHVVRSGSKIASVTGISFPKRDTPENLALQFPISNDNKFSLAALHCSCGQFAQHITCSPCSVADLASRGYDYWALGHIHTQAMLKSDGPIIAYPGNPQGLNPKETGSKGCYLVCVDDQNQAHPEFRATNSVRWCYESVSIEGLSREEDLLRLITDKIESIKQESSKPALVRLELSGRGPLHKSLRNPALANDVLSSLREQVIAESNWVWVESIEIATRPEADLDKRREAEDFVGDFLRISWDARENPEMLEAMRTAIGPLFEESQARKFVEPPTDAQLLKWLEEAEVQVFDTLTAQEDQP